MKDPVVFVVDDTHWMDEPSRDLLASLVSGTGPLSMDVRPDPVTRCRGVYGP